MLWRYCEKKNINKIQHPKRCVASIVHYMLPCVYWGYVQNEALDINIELNDPNSGNLEAFNGWLDYFKKIFGSK